MPILLFVLPGAALIVLALWIASRLRVKPRDREKRRRLAVNARGRLADGNITEATTDVIFYSYSVGGVEYVTSQDIAELREALRIEPESLIGRPVTVKYARQNPANSIVVCEQWSGLRSSGR